MYICVKLLPEDLNPGPCLPHPTSTYICEVIIALKVKLEEEKKINEKPSYSFNKNNTLVQNEITLLNCKPSPSN